MTAIVSVETVLLVLLVVLVAGLLRSHAEILRRLGPTGEPVGPAAAQRPAPRRDPRAAAIAGPTPAGDAVTLDFGGGGGRPTLLAFLSSGCSTCSGFWAGLAEHQVAPQVQTVIVTHGPEREQPARLRSLAPDGIPVVMSSRAWEDYAVPGSPYFVLVDGEVRGEGAASTWPALASLVRDAIEDQRVPGSDRHRRVEERLTAAGIGPDHPSLRPAEDEGGER
jgi:hypothetical protein